MGFNSGFKGLRSSRRCCLKFKSAGCDVSSCDVAKYRNAFIFSVQNSMKIQLPDPEDKGITILRNAGNQTTQRIPEGEFSETRMREPQIS